MGSTTVLQVLVVLGICIVIADLASAQFTSCHSAPGCSGNVVTGPTTAEECCLSESGTHYNDGSTCERCIVFGWNTSEMTAQERVEPYIFGIGYLKGGDEPNLPNLLINVKVTSGGDATLDSDFRLQDRVTNILVRPNMNPVPWRVTFSTDSTSQEQDESFQLQLVRSQDSPSLPVGPNVFFIDSISLTIQDRTEITFFFTQQDYEGLEGAGFILATIDKNQQLATPVTLVLTPLTVMRAEEENVMNNRPLPTNLNETANADDDPFSPNRAKESDFDTQPIIVTFNADEDKPVGRLPVGVNITMDEIDEASSELFVAILEVREALNQSLISDEGIRAAILRITDDDDVEIGYELRQYTFDEPPPEATDPFTIDVVRINKSIDTEQTLLFGIIVSPIEATQETETATNDFNVEGSIETLIRRTLEPSDQDFTVTIEVFPDMLPESLERFRLGISSPNPGTPTYLTGVTLADTTTVSIRDNFAMFVIGLDPESQTVNENQGYAELCANMTDPPNDVPIPPNVQFTVSLVTVEGSAGNMDYSELRPLSLLLDFDSNNRVQCFNVTIFNDSVYENTEQFSVQLTTFGPRPDNLRLEPNVTNVTIVDTTEVTIGFIGSPYSATENMGPMVFMVGVIGDTVLDRDVVVSFSTVDGTVAESTATAGSDYVQRTNVLLTFNAGTRLLDVNISLIDDDVPEMTEDFGGMLSVVSGGPTVIADPSEAIATIFDNDVACEALPPLINGRIEYFPNTTEPYAEGTVATHICDQGFILVGNEIRVCRNDSEFDGEEPSCQPIQCPALPPLVNGTITYAPDDTADFDLETVATHECNPGFDFEGTMSTVITRVCVGNGSSVVGTWNGTAPTCVPIQCLELDPLENGVITYAPDNTSTYDLGTEATHECNEGYFLFGVIVRTCGVGDEGSPVGRWSDQPPTCVPIQCPALAPLPNGNITYTPDMTADFDLGTVATHVCNPGFDFRGTMSTVITRVCQGDGSSVVGTWSGEMPICDPIQCPALPELVNGMITYDPGPDDRTDYDLGTEATHVCNFGFVLMGVMVRTCGVGDEGSPVGRWSDQPPTCVPQCPPLPPIVNGMITYAPDDEPNYDIGTVATYMCNTSFLLVGAMNRTCVMAADGTGVFDGQAPVCEPQCDPLAPLENGNITYGLDNEAPYEQGTTATYTCNAGFMLVGVSMRTCTGINENLAEFDGEAPICRLLNIIRVNDTVIGDPLMTIPLYVQNKSAITPLQEDDIVHLCFEVRGRADEYFNFVSDDCVSVNARYTQVRPNEDINIIDNIAVRAVASDQTCRNIEVDLDQCTARVDGVVIPDRYSNASISVRKYPSRVRISVPNCRSATGLVMWVMCRRQEFWSTIIETNPDGSEVTFEADAIRFVIARGLNLQETSHGILGQFWNIPIEVAPYDGPFTEETENRVPTFSVMINYPDMPPRQFVAWFQFPSWELERNMYCLYAGDAHADSMFEVPESPVNGPVIEGVYTDYIVEEQFGTEFEYSQFDTSMCP